MTPTVFRFPLGNRLWQWLALPWRAQDQGGQWFMLAILALTLGSAVLLKPVVGPDWPFMSGTFTCMAVIVIWLYLMPCCLRLTASARDLRLPGIATQIYASFALYVVLSCMLPAMFFALAGGPVLTISIACFVTAAGAFLLALLPGYVGFVVCMAPTVLGNLGIVLPAWLPRPDDAGFLPALALTGVALACLAIARWIRISAGDISGSRWRRPLICNLSATHFGNDRSAPALHTDETRFIRRRPDWLQPEADIHGAGPGNPRCSLRVALGAGWLPLTRRSHWRQTVYGSLVLAAGLAFVVLMTRDDRDVQYTLWHAMLALAGWAMLAIGCLASLSPLLGLHRRWSRPNAELPLLALLPHLDRPAHIKTRLLVTCLRLPAVRWLAWVALAWIAVCWRLGGVTLAVTLVMLAMAALGMLLIVALLLGTLGHQHLTRSGMTVLTVYVFLLSISSGGYALAVVLGSLAFSVFGIAALALFWGLLLIPLCRFIVDGRRCWQHLPHPFLALDT